MGPLNARGVQALYKPGRYGDGNGLYLNIARGGSKSWVQRIVVHGHRRDIGLGSYPTISLARARELAHANRVAVAEGRDPVKEKRESREAARSPSPSIPTFAEAASTVIEECRSGWSNPKHAAQWESTLRRYAFPVIGDMPVSDITIKDIRRVLTPIWTEKHETATRVRQRIEYILDWAIGEGWTQSNPATKSVLRSLPKVPKLENHHKAIPYSEVPAALAKVRAPPPTRSPAWPLSSWYLPRPGRVRYVYPLGRRST